MWISNALCVCVCVCVCVNLSSGLWKVCPVFSGGGGAAIAPPPSVLEDTEVKCEYLNSFLFSYDDNDSNISRSNTEKCHYRFYHVLIALQAERNFPTHKGMK